MSSAQLPLTIVVAATTKNGIGKNGALPWPMLKKEMAYFARITKRVPLPSGPGSLQSEASQHPIFGGARRNVVIMGRKTWESIPAKFRPLRDRINLVISSQERSTLGNIPDDVVVASDILAALRMLDGKVMEGSVLPIGRIFVIGGSSIYRAALGLPQCKSILLTHIHKEFDSDTFFPQDLESNDAQAAGWQRRDQKTLSAMVGEDVPAEPMSEEVDGQTIYFEFKLYERS